MKRKISSLILLLLPFQALAQNMWGTGYYGGMQSCPYQTRVGNGAVSQDDTTNELVAEIKEAQIQLKTKKNEKKKLDRIIERSKSDIAKTLNDDYSEFIYEHVENSRRCEEYKGFHVGTAGDSEFGAQGKEGNIKIANQSLLPLRAFTVAEWNQYCDSTKSGAFSADLCANLRFKQYEEGARSDVQTCKKGLTDYRKNFVQSQKLQNDIDRLEDTIARAKEDLKDARQAALDNPHDNSLVQSEGGICIECMKQSNGYSYQQNQTDWGSVIGNVALGLGSVYMGYKTNEMVANYNANIGWPTNSYNSYGYGYGLGAIGTGVSQALGGGSGIYGSISGGTGSGSFGCAGNNGGTMGMMGPYAGMNGYGMWGNPYGMSGSGSLGGGLYNTSLGTMASYDPSSMQMQMQYQQQLMQMQMQQYQSYMQYQQQYQQQSMQKYQAVSSLQQEMYSLMARMQQIQYGYGSSSYIGASGSFSSGLTPLPGSIGSSVYSSNGR